MTYINKFVQLKAFARQEALMLAALWTASFALTMMAQAGALGNLLALSTPFVVVWRTNIFRDKVLGGIISWRRAWAFCLYTFVYASLAFALVQFAYFRFLDHGSFAQLITDTMNTMMPLYEQNGMTKAEVTQSINAIRELTPVQWAFVFMLQNMVIGALASVPLALISRRK